VFCSGLLGRWMPSKGIDGLEGCVEWTFMMPSGKRDDLMCSPGMYPFLCRVCRMGAGYGEEVPYLMKLR
jgi:hypothetical protein